MKKETDIGVFQNMSQEIKILVTKLNNLISVFKTHIIEGDKRFL